MDRWIDRECEVMHFDSRVMINGNLYNLDYDVSIFEKDADEGGGVCYGVSVHQAPAGLRLGEGGEYRTEDKYDKAPGFLQEETAQVKGFSEDYREAVRFVRMLAEGKVLPMSLLEFVDDWHCAFREEE